MTAPFWKPSALWNRKNRPGKLSFIFLWSTINTFGWIYATLASLRHLSEKSISFLFNFVISLITEEKVGKLQVALKEVQNAHIKEVDQMNTQLEKQRQRTEELTEAVSELCHYF